MAAPNEITTSQLLRLIGTPNTSVLIDVTTDDDYDADPFLIPGAVRHPHTDIEGLIARLNSAPSIIICQKGRKFSQGVCAILNAQGNKSEYLQGGNYAWRDTNSAPRIPGNLISAPSLWVTRHRPKIDRIACPWLIRRFIDPAARFMFVSPGAVHDVADKFGAIAFDIDGAPYAHRDTGTGALCTFDAILDAFSLRTDALDRLSNVIRGADINAHTIAPEAAGLLAISVGLSRQYRDDHAQFNAAMPLYDALYRWARDGHSETHDSNTGQST